jgi:hypothetical protein
LALEWGSGYPDLTSFKGGEMLLILR